MGQCLENDQLQLTEKAIGCYHKAIKFGDREGQTQYNALRLDLVIESSDRAPLCWAECGSIALEAQVCAHPAATPELFLSNPSEMKWLHSACRNCIAQAWDALRIPESR